MTDLNNVLEAVNAGLGVLKAVAQTPGVNMLPYANTVSSAVEAIQLLYKAGKDIAPNVQAVKDTFAGDKIPTLDELAALDAEIAQWRAELHAPMPAAEEGEED